MIDKAYLKQTDRVLTYADKLGKLEQIELELETELVSELTSIAEEAGVELDVVINAALYRLIDELER